MSSNALTRALSEVDRSYVAAKASVSQATRALLASGPQGALVSRPDLAAAHEQLKHFTGLVYASIRPIAQKIAGQGIRVGRRATNGRRFSTKMPHAVPYTRHALMDLLADPNDLMVGWSLLFSTVASLELTGRALWYLPGKKAIYPIPMSWVTGFEGAVEFKNFIVRPPNTGEDLPLPGDQCVYFAYPNPADPHGAISPLQATGGAVDADESMTASQQAIFRNGVNPQHAILLGKQPHPDFPGGLRPHLSQTQQRQIVDAVRKRFAGVMRHGEPIILDGMIEDLKRLSNSPQEMDYLNSSKATRDRVFLGFGVNPAIAGQLENANRASSLAAEDHFVNYCVNPKIELISQCLTEWLSPMFGDDIIVWIDPCVVRDDEQRLKWAQALAQAGCVTGDELRDLSPFAAELPPGNFPEPVGKADALIAEAAAAVAKMAATINKNEQDVSLLDAQTSAIIAKINARHFGDGEDEEA